MFCVMQRTVCAFDVVTAAHGTHNAVYRRYHYGLTARSFWTRPMHPAHCGVHVKRHNKGSIGDVNVDGLTYGTHRTRADTSTAFTPNPLTIEKGDLVASSRDCRGMERCSRSIACTAAREGTTYHALSRVPVRKEP